MTLNKMVEMGLNEEKIIRSSDDYTLSVLRVPGGWVYIEECRAGIATTNVPLPAGVEHVEGVDF